MYTYWVSLEKVFIPASNDTKFIDFKTRTFVQEHLDGHGGLFRMSQNASLFINTNSRHVNNDDTDTHNVGYKKFIAEFHSTASTQSGTQYL